MTDSLFTGPGSRYTLGLIIMIMVSVYGLFLVYASFTNHPDTKDIVAISGGYVEMGTSAAAVYQEIAVSIKSFQTKRKTKQDIDPGLLKCFYLEDNLSLQSIIHKATN